MRAATGAPMEKHGSDLVEFAFNPGHGVLSRLSDVKAEQAGARDLFKGAYLFYRNPIAHRNVSHRPDETLRIVSLVNELLHVLDRAIDSLVSLDRFMGHHEGQIRHRRHFRLDIDQDDEFELVILVDVSALIPSSGDLEDGAFILLVLDTVDGKYKRVASEKIPGFVSMDGGLRAELKHITSLDRPDIVSLWGLGETGGGNFIHRWDGKEYSLVRREDNDLSEPYGGIGQLGFFTHHIYQHLQFADIDGDGLDEIVYGLGIDPMLSDASPITDSHGLDLRPSWKYHVFKWDETSGLLHQIDESTHLVRSSSEPTP